MRVISLGRTGLQLPDLDVDGQRQLVAEEAADLDAALAAVDLAVRPDVVAFALEHRVLLDVDLHIQVARRPAVGARLAVARAAERS
jgi:hypothetical protein